MMEGLKATLLDPFRGDQLFFKQNPELALAAQSKEQIRVGTGIMTFVSTRDTLKDQGNGPISTPRITGNDRPRHEIHR